MPKNTYLKSGRVGVSGRFVYPKVGVLSIVPKQLCWPDVRDDAFLHPFSYRVLYLFLVKSIKNICIIMPANIVLSQANFFSLIYLHLAFYLLVFMVFLLAFLFSYIFCLCHVHFWKLYIRNSIKWHFPKKIISSFPASVGTSCFPGCCPAVILKFLSLFSWARSTSGPIPLSFFIYTWLLVWLELLLNVWCKRSEISEILHVWTFLNDNLYIK